MKKRANRRSEMDEALCCCEYINRQGERSHVAACCCDCEDLDEVCDRWMKLQPQAQGSLDRLSAVLSDRVRVPWLWGGARRLELSVVPPLVLLPALLRLAALHFLLGVAVLTALPVLVLWYYYVTHRKKGRTLFFLSLALFSLAYMYFLFVSEVLPRGGVSPVQLAVVTGGVVLTVAAMLHTKRDPGLVRRARPPHSTVTYAAARYHTDPAFQGPVGREEVLLGPEGEQSAREDWCLACGLARPPRAGHCRICGVCVQRLDHHCVWINSCVGQANHCSFLLTLLLFLLTSLYGIGLVLRSVCPGQNVLLALLYCPGVYSQYSDALCFTCAWYCSMVTAGLLHLLLVQLVHVSLNVTEREVRLAARHGAPGDTTNYSRGLRDNWAEFMTMHLKAPAPTLDAV
ncbi:palmitoyltransferase ZDHHC23-B isoform X1 [Gadus chalcogrammus]|uniref:palmitoyltransferase ZDHHC23-B isoform X1 n=2 Tax=Gadus chalcogrammus TaxID=1042646 RepID=UPI0024C4D603|nr:palmitoyltransferase ZDHHC23-B isoform X1 [Gadus chalcogrammus]XP_056440741.1 palmitoyltransferase ZDHHC23-B isoform X1 [Gadus chalcogrammus]